MELEKEEKKIENKTCICTQTTGLFIPSRQLSYYVAGTFLFLFLMFMAGFFWGKQTVIKTCLYNLDQDFFADQISYSLYRLPDTIIQVADKQNDQENSEQENNEEESVELDVPDYNMSDAINENEALDIRVKSEKIEQERNQNTQADVQVSIPDKVTDDIYYYAPLAGFGTKKAAENFLNKLSRKGFFVVLKEHTGRTSRGNTRIWYQVVTDFYKDKSQLESIVNTLVKQENLKAVSIISC